MDKKRLSNKEKWVLEQLENGKEADLKEKFGEEEEDRRISAAFLEALLTDEIVEGSDKYKPHRRGIRISHAIIDEPLDLENAEVSHFVGFFSCDFEESATFQDARFARHLFLNDCQFRREADFNSMKVRQSAFFNNVTFKGPVDFGFADIKGQFHAKGAKFLNDKANAIFNSLKVGHIASFNEAVFWGGVEFVGAVIEGQFHAFEAHFLNEEKAANFNSMRVRFDASFRCCIFEGPVIFCGAHIGNEFQMMMATINYKKEKANFDFLRVGLRAIFGGSDFNGGISLSGADIVDLTIGVIKFPVVANGNKLILEVDSALNELNLGYTKTERIALNGNVWPKKRETVILDGLTYQAITTSGWQECPTALKDLLKWSNISRYNLQNYIQLEGYFQRSGYKERANKLFVSGKRREWVRSWKTLNPLKWASNIIKLIFLDLGVRYGRSPFRAVFYSMLFIFLGMVIFSQPDIIVWEKYQPGETISLIKAFWYSIDLFLPLISLGPDKFYQIRPDALIILPHWLGNWNIFVQTYAYIHQLMGYILVSIGLAAVTGIIK